MYFLCSFCKRCCNFATFKHRFHFCFVCLLLLFLTTNFHSSLIYLLNLRKTTHFSMSIFKSLISKLSRVANGDINDGLENCEIHIGLTFTLISPSNFSNFISVLHLNIAFKEKRFDELWYYIDPFVS